MTEFALRSKDFRMPVGRIQSVFMFPLSFEEFLNALGEEKLCGHLNAVNPDIESKFLKDVLNLLCEARCLTKICHSSGAGLPMAASVNEKIFKVAVLDVGMMQNALGIQSSIALNTPVMTINAGGVAEQFVAQELLAAADPYAEPGLFFWARDARGSNAEVDYLIHIQGKIFPVEVKAGATGSLKSMKIFLEKYPDTPFGIRYSMHELSFHDRILSIPLYMIRNTEDLIQNLLKYH